MSVTVCCVAASRWMGHWTIWRVRARYNVSPAWFYATADHPTNNNNIFNIHTYMCLSISIFINAYTKATDNEACI